jgi:hypothetical protein
MSEPTRAEKLRLLAAVAPTWTDYMSLKGAAEGINRQCAIGWHEECSDPEGDECKCHCHPHDLWPEKT